ncbi:DUF2256 domain-containing protein [Aureimonas endophytica]
MRRKSDLPEKPCRQCGRPMVWRKAWAKTWDEVAYCSDRCRAEAAKDRSARRRNAVRPGDDPAGPREAATDDRTRPRRSVPILE